MTMMASNFLTSLNNPCTKSRWGWRGFGLFLVDSWYILPTIYKLAVNSFVFSLQGKKCVHSSRRWEWDGMPADVCTSCLKFCLWHEYDNEFRLWDEMRMFQVLIELIFFFGFVGILVFIWKVGCSLQILRFGTNKKWLLLQLKIVEMFWYLLSSKQITDSRGDQLCCSQTVNQTRTISKKTDNGKDFLLQAGSKRVVIAWEGMDFLFGAVGSCLIY